METILAESDAFVATEEEKGAICVNTQLVVLSGFQLLDFNVVLSTKVRMYLRLRYVTEKLLEPGRAERSVSAELEDSRPNPQRTLILLRSREMQNSADACHKRLRQPNHLVQVLDVIDFSWQM